MKAPAIKDALLGEILSKDQCLALQTFEKGYVGEASWRFFIKQIAETLVSEESLEDGLERKYTVQKGGLELIITAKIDDGQMHVSHTICSITK